MLDESHMISGTLESKRAGEAATSRPMAETYSRGSDMKRLLSSTIEGNPAGMHDRRTGLDGEPPQTHGETSHDDDRNCDRTTGWE